MSIYNKTKQTSLAKNVSFAKSALSRAVGLLGKKELGHEDALVIPQCQAIHMFFMMFSIDVVFLDKECRVVGLVPNIRPFCLSPVFFNAYFAIELPQGSIERTKTAKGDMLDLGLIHHV